MKKLFALLLAFLALLPGCMTACAQEAVDLTQARAYETASSLCFIGDTLYMRGGYGVYAYKDDELSTVVDLSDTSAVRYRQERPEDEEEARAWERAIDRLFTDGETLYGLHPYSGQIFEIADGRMDACAALPKEMLYADDQQFYREVKGAVLESGTLFILMGTDDYADYAKTELFAFDWASQGCEALPIEGVQSIAAGAEGKLLAFVRSDTGAIWQMDAASRTLETELARIQGDEAPAGLACYDGKPVYYEENQVMLAESADQRLVKAYLPVMYASGSTQAACSKSGVYAYPGSNYVFLRDVSIQGEAKQKVLRMMGDVPGDLIVGYSLARPDVAVVSVQSLNANEMRQAAISRDSSVDLFVLSAPGIFAAMKEKGYIGALNGSEKLLADAKTLYPAIADVVFDGDTLLGYPTSIEPRVWTVNQTQWENLGLGDYPATYDELFQKIALWLDAYAEDYPDYTLSDMQQMGVSNLVFTIAEAYAVQAECGGERVTFDTPAFRSLLQSVAAHLDLVSEEHEQWGMPLISSYSMGFGTTYADQDLMRMVTPPALEPDRPQAVTANLTILCANAVSAQAQEAADFIAYCAAHLDDSVRYALHPDLNDPIENDTYKDRMATLKQELEALETQLKTADEEKKDAIEEKIASKQAMLERVAENKWSISPESIAVYREVMQNLTIPYRSSLLSREADGGYNALSSIVMQYCAEGLDEGKIQAMVSEMDRVTRMIELEGGK